jgi:hypothetical protein
MEVDGLAIVTTKESMYSTIQFVNYITKLENISIHMVEKK